MSSSQLSAISNPVVQDWRAAYAILTADERGYRVEHYRVAYDQQAAIEAAQQCSNPGAGFILRCLRGELRASWMARWDGAAHVPGVGESD